jgi:hypothetical protein
MVTQAALFDEDINRNIPLGYRHEEMLQAKGKLCNGGSRHQGMDQFRPFLPPPLVVSVAVEVTAEPVTLAVAVVIADVTA